MPESIVRILSEEGLTVSDILGTTAEDMLEGGTGRELGREGRQAAPRAHCTGVVRVVHCTIKCGELVYLCLYF